MLLRRGHYYPFSFWTSDSNWMLWTCLCIHDQLATCSFVMVSLLRPVLGQSVWKQKGYICNCLIFSTLIIISRCLYYWIIGILIKNDVKFEGRWRRYMTLWLNTFFLSWRILNILIQSKPFLLVLFRTLIIARSCSSIANLQWSKLVWFWMSVLGHVGSWTSSVTFVVY